MTDDIVWKKASGRGKPGPEPSIPRGVPNTDTPNNRLDDTNKHIQRIIMLDIEFRDGLQKVVEENPTNDAAVIQYVLEHAWEQYPRPFFIWLNRKIRAYDQFR